MYLSRLIFYLEFTFLTAIVTIPDILRENPLAFFETEETNHPQIQCNMPMVDINMIINDLSLSVKRALNTHCNVRLSG